MVIAIALFELLAGGWSLWSLAGSFSPLPEDWPTRLQLGVLALLSIGTLAGGALLLIRDGRGLGLSRAMQALQVPRLAFKYFAYGTTVGVGATVGTNASSVHFAFEPSVQGMFAVGTHGYPQVLGVNLVAIAVYYALGHTIRHGGTAK